MKKELMVSVQTSSWYDNFGGDAAADESLRFIKEIGFEAVDYNIDHTLPPRKILDGTLTDFYDAEIPELLERFRAVKEAKEKHDVEFGQAHAPFPMYVEGREDINEFLIMVVEKELAICQYLDCPALVVHPYCCDDKDKEKEINLAIYRKLIPAAKKYGVKVCLENLPRTKNYHAVAGACADAEEACWYLDTLNAEAGEDVFGFCFDVGHANLLSKNIRQEIRTLGHRITILHIHDNTGQDDHHQIPYTINATDWEGFIEGLRDINYKGTLNLETFGNLDGTRPKELAPAILKFAYEVICYIRKRVQE